MMLYFDSFTSCSQVVLASVKCLETRPALPWYQH